jgi:hypothetical protein
MLPAVAMSFLPTAGLIQWMTASSPDSTPGSLEALEPLVGEWRMVPEFEGMPPAGAGAGVSFEWLPGKRFLIQRWEIPVPEAPDGIAIIGADPEREGGYLQHYFDSRGVARVYKMSFEDRVWRLWRDELDLSPLDFAQRGLVERYGDREPPG